MSKFKEFTIPWNHTHSSENAEWDIDLEVTFKLATWTERHPFGSTYATERMTELEITGLSTPALLPEELYESIVEALEEDEEFLEAATKHASEQNNPENFL